MPCLGTINLAKANESRQQAGLCRSMRKIAETRYEPALSLYTSLPHRAPVVDEGKREAGMWPCREHLSAQPLHRAKQA